jgi:hypothetical protein
VAELFLEDMFICELISFIDGEDMILKCPKRGVKYSDRIVNKNIMKRYTKTDFTYLFVFFNTLQES